MSISLAVLALAAALVTWHFKTGRRRPPADEHFASPIHAVDATLGPSVILIVIDATRRDALSPYGGVDPERTPNIALLAREGVVFEACYSAAAFSGPSYASLLTGQYPPGHGVFDHPNELPLEVRSLMEVAADAGFYTLHVTQHGYLRERWQYPQGADYYHFSKDEKRLVGGLVSWIETHPGVPFVALVALTKPHFPYGLRKNPDGLLEELSVRDRVLHRSVKKRRKFYDLASTGLSADYVAAQRVSYQLEVEVADRLVGQIVAAVERSGRASDTAIIVTSDHGEAFGEHGFHFCHDPVVYGPVSRVPLIVSWPGRLTPGRAASVVSLVDVLPTVAEWIGGVLPDAVDGRSLVPLLRASEPSDERTAYCYSRPHGPKTRAKYRLMAERYQRDSYAGSSMLGARGRWDVVLRPTAVEFVAELFDRVEDPLHLDDLWSVHGSDPEVQRLLADLHAYRRDFLAAAMPTVAPLTEEQRQGLRELGYIE